MLNTSHLDENKRQVVEKAYALIKQLYGSTTRKYSEQPSYYHCVEVFNLVAERTSESHILLASLMHDAIEDFPNQIDYAYLLEHFGSKVARLVSVLSKPKLEGMTRNQHNILYWQQVSQSDEAKLIKLADTYSNISGTGEPHDFRSRYLHEKAMSYLFIERPNCPLSLKTKNKLIEELTHLVGLS